MNLIERLRKGIVTSAPYEPQYTVPPVKICLEAADELEHLTEMVEQLIVGAVACVEVVVENERLFSENKLLNYKLEEEQKKTATLSCVLAEPLLATIQRTVRTGAKEMSLIDRLRDTASKGISAWGDLQLEAADELERLTAEEKMQLEQIVNQGLEIERLNKEVNDLRDEVVAGDQDIERLTVLAYHQGLEIKWLTAELTTSRYWREQEVKDLTAELARAKEYHAGELADVVAERDALKAALQLIKANTNTADWPDDINAAIQGEQP